ncbi:MAG: glycosyltransferase [Woeseiaceae bacterium]|nr:glycosyltransferase [Woeseiaceae bacterium]NIP20841.1 glycosyltransferase [Woeseiaceae bacterium]NIS89634.1 glycosyltransferase [Woeseiaceae bacterium]
MKICVLIPHYDHVGQFRDLLPRLLGTEYPFVIVDDASPEAAFEELQQLLDESRSDATVIRHADNRGKGGAVTTGLLAAYEAGYTHALQIDADGQHDVAHVADFCRAGEAYPGTLICGEPVFDESISKLRYYGRYLTHSLVWLETLSTEIRDAMCGFRLYPLEPVVQLLQHANIGSRMAFDPEVLVRASWAGIPIRFIPVRVRYPEGGASHFRYFRDNVQISWMHTRLIFGMLVRLPSLLARRVRRRRT